MRNIAIRPVLKITLYSMVFLSFFIIPFVLFGSWLEKFAHLFISQSDSDYLSILFAASLLAADPILPTPSSVVATLLAAKVGFLPAALINAASLSFACFFGYYLGQSGGWIWKRSGRAIPPGFNAWVQQYGLVAVLLCRPVPILAEASLMIAGAARHDKRALFGWCTLTQCALGAAYAFAGSGWGQGRWDNWAILTGSMLVPLCATIIVLIAMGRVRYQATKSSHI